VGSRKEKNAISDILKSTQDYLMHKKESGFKTDSDGVFLPEETHWTNHVLTFNADHAELIGVRPNYNTLPIYKRICEVVIP
jgi:hypothetical protein